VVENLNKHVHPDAQYPTPDSLRSLITSGPPVRLLANVSLSYMY
jgi:hypothetical protein